MRSLKRQFEQTDYDNWNGGTYTYALKLRVPAHLYAVVEKDIEQLEKEMLSRLTPLLRGYSNEHLGGVIIGIELENDEQWRKNALAWVGRQATETAPIASKQVEYDFFISHASEDKDSLVRPVARGLADNGVRVWYDEFELKVGDSLRRSIDRGLANSSFGIVVLSRAFFGKNWPQYELDGLTARQMIGKKVILPVWHGIDRDFIHRHSPSLADTLAFSSGEMTVDEIIKAFTDFLHTQ